MTAYFITNMNISILFHIQNMNLVSYVRSFQFPAKLFLWRD